MHSTKTALHPSDPQKNISPYKGKDKAVHIRHPWLSFLPCTRLHEHGQHGPTCSSSSRRYWSTGGQPLASISSGTSTSNFTSRGSRLVKRSLPCGFRGRSCSASLKKAFNTKHPSEAPLAPSLAIHTSAPLVLVCACSSESTSTRGHPMERQSKPAPPTPAISRRKGSMWCARRAGGARATWPYSIQRRRLQALVAVEASWRSRKGLLRSGTGVEARQQCGSTRSSHSSMHSPPSSW